MSKFSYKKYSKEDQKALAIWALDCAERVIPYFENAYPNDTRPRSAIETGRRWAKTGDFKMAEIRGASLSAHAAAKDVKENVPACMAAHAAGQAVATAHVTQHAYGGAYYALKAIIAANPDNAETKGKEEYEWQAKHLPENLRGEITSRLVIEKRGKGIKIKILKGEGF